MFSMNNGFSLYRKIASDVLKDDRTAWQKFWEDYRHVVVGLSILVALIVIAGLIWFFESYTQKRKEKLSNTTETYDGVSVATYKTCTVSLIRFKEITLVKGTEFAAPIPDKDGFVFCGWFYDTACTIPYKTTKIRKSITLYPKWTKES